METNRIYHGDCQSLIREIPDRSVDCICTDPPYLYLEKQKLDREFDERALFAGYKRILKPFGFIILFGRGTSFYRWNTILSELGFNFKEEIIWNKVQSTSPMFKLSRVHETISIHSKGNNGINKIKVPYIEMKKYDIDSVIQDVKRLMTTFKNAKSFSAVQDFLTNNGEGKNIIRVDRAECDRFTKFKISTDKRKSGDRCCNAMQSMEFGLNEKSIIKATRDHYTAIHPTQKPVPLIERLLALVRPKDVENPVVLDTFAGSCTTAIAAINSGWKYICMEIDDEYYNKGAERVNKYRQQGVQQSLF